MSTEEKVYCLIDGQNGIYLPQVFAERYPEFIEDKNALENLLKGPDANMFYWDDWTDTLDNVSWQDEDGNTWTLWQDSDLFAVREDFDVDNWE